VFRADGLLLNGAREDLITSMQGYMAATWRRRAAVKIRRSLVPSIDRRQTPIAQIVGAGLMEDGYAATTTVTRWGEDAAELNFHISCELGA
jgi:hypothetical protein